MILHAVAVPVVPAVAWALVDLAVAVTFVVCLGLLWTWKGTIGKLFTWLGHKEISASVHGFGFKIAPFGFMLTLNEQAIGALDAAVAGTEHAMVYAFRRMVGAVLWTGQELSGLAVDSYNAIAGVRNDLKGLTAAAAAKVSGGVVALIHSIVDYTAAHLRKDFDKLFHRHEARIAHLEHVAGTRARPGFESGAIALPNTIPALSARVGITSRQLRRLSRRLSSVEKLLVGGVAVAAVVTALGRLKLGWLRCPSLLRMGNKLGCVGFGWLEAFFATTFEALVVLDLCRFALAAQKLARSLVPNLAGVLLVQNAVCLGGGASLPSAHDSPKTLTKITLPSAHD